METFFFMVASAIAFPLCGTYRMVWRYVSFRDIFNVIRAVSLTCLIFFCGLFLWFLAKGIHITYSSALIAWTFGIMWIATLALVATPRLVSRFLAERRNRGVMLWPLSRDGHDISTLLLAGNPERMDAFIRECVHRENCAYDVIGVFTSDGRLHESNLNGVKVYGAVDAIPDALRDMSRRGVKPDYIVLADDDAGEEELERLLEAVAGADIRVGRLPPLNAFQDAPAIRPIALADLLGRPEISCDDPIVATLIERRCVMITGAGGSIGSELCRQVARLQPTKIVLLDNGEFNLYSIDRELQETFPDLERLTALVDVRDADLVGHLVNTMRPDVVFHAAALKHVPLLEEHPIEAAKTNVLGTRNVANACRANGVKAMVTISTDKAVNPHNVMGATKRLAEAYCQGLDQSALGGAQTRFMTVRFGNVLGSAGSVVPLFHRQIETGGPVTVTHRDIARFFMTIPEAVTLVLQAGAHGVDLEGERASIYVLDMGEPVKIIDLATKMIRLSGYRPGIDMEIKIVGLRPGEKLYEEIVHNDETMAPTANKSIMKVAPRFTDLRIIQQQILELSAACADADRDRVLRLLRLSVPESTLSADVDGRSTLQMQSPDKN